MTADYPILVLDRKHFPITCCGQEFTNPKTFMDHVLKECPTPAPPQQP